MYATWWEGLVTCIILSLIIEIKHRIITPYTSCYILQCMRLRMLVDILFYLFQLFNQILVDTGKVLCLGLASQVLDLGLCLDSEVLGLVSSGLDYKSAGHPRNRWLDLVGQDSNCFPADSRRKATHCGHSARMML